MAGATAATAPFCSAMVTSRWEAAYSQMQPDHLLEMYLNLQPNPFPNAWEGTEK